MLAFLRNKTLLFALSCTLYVTSPVALATPSTPQYTLAKEKAITSPLYVIKAKRATFRHIDDGHYQLMIPVKHITTIEQIADRPKRFLATIKPENLALLIKHGKTHTAHEIANMRLAWTKPSKEKNMDQAIFTIARMRYTPLFIRFELKPLHTNAYTPSDTLPKRIGPISAYIAN